MPVQMHPETAVGELKAGAYTFPLQEVDVKGEVQGLLYSATVTQKFRNERNERMEAVYVFPLPPKAAVHGFKLTVGDRVIEGEIKERGQARREYKQAVQQGHRAALMEEERSDIFTTTVGNIGAGEEVTISFEMSGPLSSFKNRAKLTLPLVVGEVFVPGSQLAGNSVGDGTAVDTDEVPDASRITPPRLADGAPNSVQLSVQFTVHPAGLQMSQVQSTCHFARTKKFEDGRVRVSLLPGVERMDRAFVLEVVYPENTLQTSLLVDDKTKTFALTVVPPVTNERTAHPRDVVILLDRSGSMNGWPMIAARRATARIIDSLTEQDRFGIIAFDNNNDHFDFKGGLQPANNFYKMKAAEWLSKVDANGGTYVLPALRDGMNYFRLSDNRDPHIILLTDGDVGNDSSLIRTCQQGVRISTIGIGYAAREGLLNRMAETSGGLCSLIPNESDLDRDLADMHRKWGQPVWKGLTLRGADAEFRSPKFWDVWQDVPSTFFGQLDDPMAKTQVRGWLQGQGEYIEELSPIAVEGQVVYRSWARSRLLDLEDLFLVSKASPQDLVKLSVDAQVLCRFTAFTAVDKAEKVNTEQRMEQVMQPVEQTIAKSRSGLAMKRGRVMSQGPSQKPMLSMRSSAPPPPPMELLCEEADLFCDAPAAEMSLFECAFEPEPSPERQASGWLGDSDESVFGSPAAPSRPSPGGGALKREKIENTDGAERIKTMLQRDTLLELGESPSQEALKDCLDIARALIKEVTEGLRNGSLSAGDNRWREFVSKLMDYSEALEEAIDSGSLKATRQLRKELEAMLTRS